MRCNRVAQIVESWQRRCEKVEEERENGRKWRERECFTPVKYDSVLLRNVKVWYFLSQNVKIQYFLSQNLKPLSKEGS